jgi:aminopeptidase
VEAGIAARRDDVIVVAGAPQHRELLVAIAEAAYRRGARHVELDVIDPLFNRTRFTAGGPNAIGVRAPWLRQRTRALMQPDAAIVHVVGEGDPDALAGVTPNVLVEDATRLRKQTRAYAKAIVSGGVRWAIAGWPTEAWARQVYPDLDAAAGQRRLARDLLHFCRLDPRDGDGITGWVEHAKTLEKRKRTLTRLKLERLELRAPGTELELRLAPGALWSGGRWRTKTGRTIAPNMPTEEVFTSPEAAGTEGTFRCSRPLVFRGTTIEGIAGEFRGGRLVRVQANRQQHRDLLAAFLDTDRGARRLGEVALVDNSSRIGRAHRHYFSTLLDENAAAHIAFGEGFPETRPADGSRVNHSALHLDVMIGTDDLEVTGYGARGRRIPLIADGTWQV